MTTRALTLTEPPAAFLVPREQPLAFIVVGCGGAGAYVAQGLARLMVENQRRGGPRMVLMLIDGDHVEPHNCGRQLFAPSEVGRNKAAAIASRLSAVWGIHVTAVTKMATSTLLQGLTRDAPGFHKVLIGCVDNAEARRSIAATMSLHWLTIDCGNDEHDGQVAVGTPSELARLKGCMSLGSVAQQLPSPSLVYPNLLVDPAVPVAEGEDCAIAVEENRQGLNVNQWVADVAVQYATAIALERRITTFRTQLDLRLMSMRSWPITAVNLATATAETLRRPPEFFTTPDTPQSYPHNE